MSRDLPRRGSWVIAITFLAAFVLSVLPLPEGLQWGRPAWVAMGLIYWVIAAPHRIGVMTGWMLGLVMDGLMGTPLGTHPLALGVVAYLAYLLHQRIRVFPLWQQCLTVLILVGFYQLVIRVVQGLVAPAPPTWSYWLPTLVSAAFWPWVMPLLRYLRRRYQIA